MVALVGDGVASGGGPDIEVQYPQGVAAEGGGLQHVGMEAGVGASVGGALEGVCLVVADGVRDGVVVGRTDVEPHDDGGVGACCGGYHHRAHHDAVGHRGVEGGAVPGDGQLVEADVAVEAAAGVPLDMESVTDGGVAAPR